MRAIEEEYLAAQHFELKKRRGSLQNVINIWII